MTKEPSGRAGRRHIPMWGKLYLVGAAITVIFVVSGHLGKTSEGKTPSAGTSGPVTQIPAPNPTAAEAIPIQDAASMYVERIEANWLPEARSLPSEPPADDGDFGKLLSQINGLAVDLEDGSKLSLSGAQLVKWDQLAAVLSSKQKTLLPAMRRRYGAMLDAKLFRRDIRVSTTGASALIIGKVFVRNANVEDMQTELQPILAQLRFREVEYRWSPHLATGLKYDLPAPADGVIATWTGASFSLSQRPIKDDPNRKADPACVPEKAAAIGLKC